MLAELATDYASYLKLNVSDGFQPVQDVIDNMLTRLEELTTVLQMIKSKTSEGCSLVSEDISRHRAEVTTLSKKVNSIHELILVLENNVALIEKEVEKAELDFGINNDNIIKNLLWSFLKRNKDSPSSNSEIVVPKKIEYSSTLNYFMENTE